MFCHNPFDPVPSNHNRMDDMCTLPTHMLCSIIFTVMLSFVMLSYPTSTLWTLSPMRQRDESQALCWKIQFSIRKMMEYTDRIHFSSIVSDSYLHIWILETYLGENRNWRYDMADEWIYAEYSVSTSRMTNIHTTSLSLVFLLPRPIYIV